MLWNACMCILGGQAVAAAAAESVKKHQKAPKSTKSHTHTQQHIQYTQVFIRDCTVVSGMALLLFGGPLAVLHEAGQLLVGGWLKIKAAAQVGALLHSQIAV